MLQPCTPDLYPALLHFLDRAFNKDRENWFPAFYPHLFSASAAERPESLRNHFVHLEEGRIAAAIGIYPLRLRLGAVELKVGGIGSVSVDPARRGAGLMSRMLPAAISILERDGYDISILEGDRLRYRRYGWELGGGRAYFRLALKDLQEAGDFREEDPRRFLPRLRALQAMQRKGAVRSAEKWDLLLARQGFAVRYGRRDGPVEGSPERLSARHGEAGAGAGDGAGAGAGAGAKENAAEENGAEKSGARDAYLVHDRLHPESVHEIAGDPEVASALLRRHLSSTSRSFAHLHHPLDFPWEGKADPLARHLSYRAGDIQYQPASQYRLIHPDSCWRKLSPLLAQQAESLGRTPGPEDAEIKARRFAGLGMAEREALLHRLLGFGLVPGAEPEPGAPGPGASEAGANLAMDPAAFSAVFPLNWWISEWDKV